MARRRRINAYSNLGTVAFVEERPARQLAETGPAGETPSPGGPAGLPEIARRLGASQAREQAAPNLVEGRRYRAENGEAFTLIRLEGESAIVRFAGEAHDEQHKLHRLGKLSELRQRDPDFVSPAARSAADLPAIIPSAGTPGRTAETAQAIMRAAPVAALLAGALAIGFLFTRAIFGAGL